MFQMQTIVLLYNFPISNRIHYHPLLSTKNELWKQLSVRFLPQVANMCVYAPAPPADMAGEDIVASSCTYPGNTLLLYIPQSAHFLTEVEN